MTLKLTRRQALASGTAAAALTLAPPLSAAPLPPVVTDAQVHIWQPGGERKPSPSGRQEPFSAEELLAEMDAAGVDRAVIVPPSWAPSGNGYALESAAKYPDRLAVTGLLGMEGPDAAEKIEAWMEPAGMKGLRMFLSHERGAEYLASGGADWLWPILEEKGIPAFIHAGDSLPVLAAAAEAHPGMTLCLDALGFGRGAELEGVLERFEKVAELASLPNVLVKTGALPEMSQQAYPFADTHALMRAAYDAFGPDRLIFASDITLLKVPYKEAIDSWTALDWMSEEDLAKVLNGNIARVLGWPA